MDNKPYPEKINYSLPDVLSVKLLAVLPITCIFLACHPSFSHSAYSGNSTTFYARFSVPLIINKKETMHYNRQSIPDKITEENDYKTTHFIHVPNAQATLSHNTIRGKYERDNEKITFSGTFSANGKKLTSLRFNYSYSLVSDYSTHKVTCQFEICNLAVNRFINTNRINCQYVKDSTYISVESYYYLLMTKSSYQDVTQEQKLVWADEDYFKHNKVLWNIFFIDAGKEEKPAIAIKGNSSILSGFVMAGLAKEPDLQVIDLTDLANTKRNFEVSMKEICTPEHISLAKRAEENLKYPWPCSTTVTITETRDAGAQVISARVLVQGKKGKKELNYQLNYKYQEFSQTNMTNDFRKQLMANVDEILATVNQLK